MPGAGPASAYRPPAGAQFERCRWSASLMPQRVVTLNCVRGLAIGARGHGKNNLAFGG